jgi:iron complex transport system substrate-binding protein
LAVYRTRLDALAALRPDVVLTQVQAASGALSVDDAQTSLRALCGGAPVRIVQLDAESLDSAWAEVAAVGAALGAAAKGEALAGWCRARVSAVTSAARGRGPPRRVAVVQWAAPLFIAGGWVPELVRAAGGVDACAVPPGGASLALQPQQLAAAAPDVLLLAICGVGVEAAAAEAPALAAALGADAWAALRAVRRGAVVAADAVRLFSRAGPALADTAELLLEVLWPEAQPHGHEGSAWRRVTVNADALQQQCQAASAGNAADSSAEASRERAADREFAYV